MPLYFCAGALSYISADVGGGSAGSWLPISYTLAAAVPIPFCGYLQDIFGRRVIALGAALLVIIGAIIMGTAHSFSQGVAGMALSGAGAGIAELSALAGYVTRSGLPCDESLDTDSATAVSPKLFQSGPGVIA